jgi:hypothetical protein
VREIRTLRAMWRALETEPRQILNGHEGNLGNKPRTSLRAAAPALDPTRSWFSMGSFLGSPLSGSPPEGITLFGGVKIFWSFTLVSLHQKQ